MLLPNFGGNAPGWQKSSLLNFMLGYRDNLFATTLEVQKPVDFSDLLIFQTDFTIEIHLYLFRAWNINKISSVTRRYHVKQFILLLFSAKIFPEQIICNWSSRTYLLTAR